MFTHDSRKCLIWLVLKSDRSNQLRQTCHCSRNHLTIITASFKFQPKNKWNLSNISIFLLNFFVYCSCYFQLRRERIAERMKSLQELVPNANKVTSQNSHPF